MVIIHQDIVTDTVLRSKSLHGHYSLLQDLLYPPSLNCYHLRFQGHRQVCIVSVDAVNSNTASQADVLVKFRFIALHSFTRPHKVQYDAGEASPFILPNFLYDALEISQKKKKERNKQLLTAGLVCTKEINL